MEATIEKRVKELVGRMKGFRNSNPSEQELRQFSIDYLSVRRELDNMDTNLKKICAGYYDVNNAWYDRYPIKDNMGKESINHEDLFGRLL